MICCYWYPIDVKFFFLLYNLYILQYVKPYLWWQCSTMWCHSIRKVENNYVYPHLCRVNDQSDTFCEPTQEWWCTWAIFYCLSNFFTLNSQVKVTRIWAVCETALFEIKLQKESVHVCTQQSAENQQIHCWASKLKPGPINTRLVRSTVRSSQHHKTNSEGERHNVDNTHLPYDTDQDLK